MDDAARKRKVARLDYAISTLNDGVLPTFDAWIDNERVVPVSPCDGTPETAIEIVRKRLSAAGRVSTTKITVLLQAHTATKLIKACPMFYQGKTSWEELLP